MEYKSNPKHSEPWQRGQKGSQCDPTLRPLALKILEESVLVGQKRYAVHNGKAFCGQQEGNDVWHGYPVGWIEVPEKLRRNWIAAEQLSRRDVKKHWEAHT
jgi:hypothetical protein